MQTSMHKAGIPGDAGSELAEVVKFLRREKETLEVRVSLAEQEALRWQQQAEADKRAAQEARSRLSAEAGRARGIILAESEHRSLMEKAQQLKILHESNVTLRCASWHAPLLASVTCKAAADLPNLFLGRKPVCAPVDCWCSFCAAEGSCMETA